MCILHLFAVVLGYSQCLFVSLRYDDFNGHDKNHKKIAKVYKNIANLRLNFLPIKCEKRKHLFIVCTEAFTPVVHVAICLLPT